MSISTPLLLLLAVVFSASAQVPLVAYPPSMPAARSYDATDYNLRFGPVRLKLDAGTEMTFTDNSSLATTGGQSDFSFGSDLGIQAVWPVRPDRHLAVRVGIGYRYHTALPSSSHLVISPDTAITYDLKFSDVRLMLSSSFEVNSDATSRVDLFGGAGKDPALFRQLRSQHLAALYLPIRRSLAIQTGYVLSRESSISGEFEDLNAWGHAVFVAFDWHARRELNVGIFSSYGVADMDTQPDASTWAVGPTLRWQPAQALSITAHLAHTETAGQLGSSGLAVRVKVDHQVRRGISQTVALDHGASLSSSGSGRLSGTTSVSYSIGVQIAPRVSVSSSLGWTGFQSDGLEGDQWRAGFGCHWTISNRWALHGSWNLTQRRAGGGDYVVNNLAVGIRRGF